MLMALASVCKRQTNEALSVGIVLGKPRDADDWLIPWMDLERQNRRIMVTPERRAAKLIAATPFISLPIGRTQGRDKRRRRSGSIIPFWRAPGPKPSRIACRASSRRRKRRWAPRQARR